MSEALCSAAYNGYIDRVRGYLDEGVGLDAAECPHPGFPRAGLPRCTPVARAADGGHADIVKLLLEAGAPADAVNSQGETALQIAIMRGNMEILELLIAAGVDPKADDNVRMFNLAPNARIVRWLASLGARPTEFHVDSHTDVLPKWLASRSRTNRSVARERYALLKAVADVYDTPPPELISLLDACQSTLEKAEPLDWSDLQRTSRDDWATKISEEIGGSLQNRHGDLRGLVDNVLCQPDAIAHEAWGRLLTQLMNLTWTYAMLTTYLYGEAGTVDDDDGRALETYHDEQLHTVDLCLELLALPEAVQRDDWAALVDHVCQQTRNAIGRVGVGDEAASALLGKAYVQEHPEYESIVAAAAEAFGRL